MHNARRRAVSDRVTRSAFINQKIQAGGIKDYNLKFVFNVHGSVHSKNILMYIQQAATLHSLFYLETALHVSAATSTHHQERKELYLQHLVFVTPLELVSVCTAHSNQFQLFRDSGR